MTVINPPVWVTDGEYTAEMDRIVTGVLFNRATNAAGTTVKLDGGVIPPYNQMQVTPDGTSMVLTVSAGVCVIPRATVDPPGVYVCYNEGPETVTLDAPDASYNRYDLVIAKAYDQEDGAPSSSWGIEVVKGTAGPSPGIPGDPTGTAIVLAVILVKTAASNGGVKVTTAQVTDRRVFMSGLGGVHLVWNGSLDPSHSPGRMVYNAGSKAARDALRISDGAGWQSLYTKEEWLAYNEIYKPRTLAKYSLVSKYVSTSVWDATITAGDGVGGDSVMDSAYTITDVVTPSGRLRVDLSAVGRVQSSGDAGSVSYSIRKVGDSDELSPASTTRGLTFWSTQWNSSHIAVTHENLAKGARYVITVKFLRDKASSGTAADDRVYFNRIRLTATPQY